jgi:phage-related protein (TIGR01555 family)
MVSNAMVKTRPTLSRTQAKQTQQIRNDSTFQNLLTGIGTSADRRRSSTPAHPVTLVPSDMSDLYRGGGLAKRVVDTKVNDALRHWFRVSGDEDDKLKTRMEEVGLQPIFMSAAKQARLYGGSILLMVLDDGQELYMPVNEERDNKIQSLVVFNRGRVVVTADDLQLDVTKPKYLEPDSYLVTPVLGGTQLRIHASRVIRFDGDRVPWDDYQGNGYWHDSVLQTAYEPLRQFGAVLDSCEFITEQYVLNVFKMNGLVDVVRAPNGTSIVQNRIDAMDKSLHVANTFLCDTSEEMEKKVSSVAGLSEIVDQFKDSLCASTGYPVTKLFGTSPGGLNATGESDISMYDDDVVAMQENDLRWKLEPLLKMLWHDVEGGEPEQWSIVWNPLRQPTPSEEAELYKKIAEGDEVYIRSDVLAPEQIEHHRFVGDSFNTNPPVMTEEEFKAAEAEREKEAAEELKQMVAMREQMGQGGEPGAEGDKGNGGAAPPAAGDEGDAGAGGED